MQFPSSGDLPDPGIKPATPGTPALQADSLPLSHQGCPYIYIYISHILKWKNGTLYIYRLLYQNLMGTINTKQKTTIDTHIQKKKSPKHNIRGLPWWLRGQESTCQCRTHRFDSWYGKIPHAVRQLSPCMTSTEPITLKPVLHNESSHSSEKSRPHN